ncbi:MAG: ankyrin repeat domain-containing protein [Legionellaceae bacterium]|nr:ankyrin repeat domain-containing protein [Legionellaceae bacterium]
MYSIEHLIEILSEFNTFLMMDKAIDRLRQVVIIEDIPDNEDLLIQSINEARKAINELMASENVHDNSSDESRMYTFLYCALISLSNLKPINSEDPYTLETLSEIDKKDLIYMSTGHAFKLDSIIQHLARLDSNGVPVFRKTLAINALTQVTFTDRDIDRLIRRMNLVSYFERMKAIGEPVIEAKKLILMMVLKEVKEIIPVVGKDQFLLAFIDLIADFDVDVNVKDNYGTTPLMVATLDSNLDAIKYLLFNGADTKLVDNSELTSYQLASLYAVEEAIAAIEKFGGDSTLSQAYEKTKNLLDFFSLVRTGDVNQVRSYCYRNPSLDVTASDPKGNTAIFSALQTDNRDVCDYLMERGCKFSPDEAIRLSATACFIMASEKDISHISGEIDSNHMLYQAAYKGLNKIVEALFKVDSIDLEYRFNGYTPAAAATQQNSYVCLDLLLKHGADKNTFTDDGIPLAYKAVVNNSVESLQVLIEHGVCINLATDEGTQPIYKASSSGNSVCLALLISAGADINSMYSGFYPAHIAVKMGNLDCLKILLKAGFDHNTLLPSRESLLDIAQDYDQIDCIAFLEAYFLIPAVGFSALPEIDSFIPERPEGLEELTTPTTQGQYII